MHPTFREPVLQERGITHKELIWGKEPLVLSRVAKTEIRRSVAIKFLGLNSETSLYVREQVDLCKKCRGH